MNIKNLFELNLITFYLNFKNFRFSDAIKLPVMVFGKVSVHSLSGEIKLNGKITTGRVLIGYSKLGIFEKKVRTTFNINGKLVFDGSANIGRGSSLSVAKGSELFIGDRFTITGKSAVICSGNKNITFGKNNLLSWDILVMNTDFHELIDNISEKKINDSKDVILGNNVWIGCRTLILKGSKIADNITVGANSLISSELGESNSAYAGNPVKRIKENVIWKK